MDRVKERSALYYLLRVVRGAMLARDIGVAHSSTDWESVSWTSDRLSTPDPTRAERLRAYEARLSGLAERASLLGATPIFVTQPARTRKLLDGLEVGLAEPVNSPVGPLNGLDRHDVLSSFNERLLAAATRVGAVPVDLAGELEFEDADFYDTAHNTPEGARKIGRFLFEALLESGVLADLEEAPAEPS